MRLRFIIISLLIIMPCISNLAQPKTPNGMKWKKVEALSDEFDSWDKTKWTKPLWNYGEPVKMVAQNSGVKNGKLWIKGTLGDDEKRWFESCRVMSKAKIKFPMYTECSMRTSDMSAFSTYWLNNGNSNDRDEIDICEHNTKPSWLNEEDRPYTMYAQYFIVKDGDTERAHAERADTRNLSDNNPAKDKKWNQEFQTLGCYWKNEHEVIFYINGEQAGSVKSTQKFTREQNIIWDLWTSPHKWTGGIVDKKDLANDDINTMYVDWIHTYELVGFHFGLD